MSILKTKFILTALVVAMLCVGLVFFYLQDADSGIREEWVKPSLNPLTDLDGKNLSRDKRLDEQRITRLTDKVTELEIRLKQMESAFNEHVKNQAVSRRDKPNLSKAMEKAKSDRFSEADFSHWLDDALSAGHFDTDETQMIMAKAEKSLAVLSGVNIEGMECGKSFCRAKFTSETGKPFNVAEVFGASPFMGAGFTINEPDGSVKVYFTQPGQSIDELRKEAEKTVFDE